MCRILGIEATTPIDAIAWTRAFAVRCRDSREYQGHGWGACWWTDEGWRHYRSLRPIWEDSFKPPPTRAVLVHARSAFRNEGIEVSNNMPFVQDDLAFAFNGELRGVRLSTPGATGAARLFHLLGRFRDAAGGDVPTALARLDAVIAKRTAHVRALNAVVANGPSLAVTTRFTEDDDYFTMYAARVPDRARMRLVASEPLSVAGLEPEWLPIPNGTSCTLEALVRPSDRRGTTSSKRDADHVHAGRADGVTARGSVA